MATAALGTALLVPLRDERRGRRATHVKGTVPLRPDFRGLTSAQPPQPADNDSLAEIHADEGRLAADMQDAAHVVTAFTNGRTNVASPNPSRAGSETLRVARTLFNTRMFQAWGLDIANAVRASLRRRPVEDCVTTVTERPFADELAALLKAERHSQTGRSVDLGQPRQMGAAQDDVVIEPASTLAADITPSAPLPHAERPTSHTEQSANQNAVEKYASWVSEPHLAPDDRTPPPDADRTAEGTTAAQSMPDPAVAEECGDALTLVVSAKPSSLERVIPLTRLPLRAVATDISWASQFGTGARDERHALLARIRRGEQDAPYDTLVSAYQQEDAEGRNLALSALARRFPYDGIALFVDALATGNDGERAIAVDALVAAGQRQALTTALDDRVEAIAARAALAFVGTTVRADYVAALGTLVDEARLGAILGLLAGLVE